MLTFKSRQFDTLAAGRSERFRYRLCSHLATTYSAHLSGWSPDALSAFSDAVVRAAAQWGFRAERDVAELAMLMMEVKLVARAQRPPEWFLRIVTDESLHAPAKLHHLIATWQQELPRSRLQSGFAAVGMSP